MHKISEEELVEKLKFVAKGEPKGKPTYGMPIPEAMGRGKGYMSKGGLEVNAPKKKKKTDEVLRRKHTITFADNLLEDPDQLKLKIKAHEKILPDAQLLLDLKQGQKESRKERIPEEIRKGPGEGSSAVPDSPDHNDSSNSSIWESSDDDKTESDNDFDNRDNDDTD
ncbi:hypothetical protein Tco_1320861 [Tanacetum coccineum]